MTYPDRTLRISTLLLVPALIVLALIAFVPANLAAAPQSDTTFVSVTAGEPAVTLDPALAYDNGSADVLQQIYETLLLVNQETREYVPQIAARWEISANADQFTFYLQPDPTFQNGGTLTAHDVAYSIQRGLLQSDPISPQWLLIQSVMGYDSGDITEEIDGGAWAGNRDSLIANADPGDLRAVCEKVKERVLAEDAVGMVTFKLAESDASFPDILASYGYIIDQEWAVAQGDWDGSCATWQNFYAPSSPFTGGSPLNDKTNGSGPFKLQSWTEGSELVLTRHNGYWRRDPVWPGGPAGPAALSKVTYKVVEDDAQRLQMLLNGQADRVYLSGVNLEDKVLLDGTGGDLTLKNADGILKAYGGLPLPVALDAFFTYQINTDNNPYAGSGQLDGNGIPPDFFNDIHVRKAFSYAFDYNAYNNQVYDGQAIRRTGPIIAYLMGYAPDQPTYNYNPTKATQELSAAWGGQLPSKGFHLTIPYIEGNAARQAAAEIIKQGIEALDPQYQIDVVSLPRTDYLSAHQNGTLPIALMGWLQDYPHPKNWLEPYLYGGYAQQSRLPEAWRVFYQTQTENCLSKTGAAARACYEAIQVDTHDRAAQLYLLQATSVQYVRAEVRGFDQALSHHAYPYLYAVSKGTAPVVIPWSPGNEINIAVDAGGTPVNIALPKTAFDAPVNVLVEESSDVRGKRSTGFFVGETAFTVTAFDESGMELPLADWVTPLIVTVGNQSPQQAKAVGDLLLVRWNGRFWADETCGDYAREGDTFSVPICKPGLYAAGEEAEIGFIPIVSNP